LFRPLRGTQDLPPEEMAKRLRVFEVFREVAESYGYQPFEAPSMESWELLTLKSGEEVARQIYFFKDKAGRDVGLRFDLTIGLARYVASRRDLPLPFKRYSIGKVWRYERPSAGRRLREFYQADVDVVGSSSPLSDAEVIAVAVDCLRRLGLEDLTVRVNDRRILEGFVEVSGAPKELSLDVFRAIDKLDKIGEDGVAEELRKLGLEDGQVERLMELISAKGDPDRVLSELEQTLRGVEVGLEGCRVLRELLEYSEYMGVGDLLNVDASLARGLDYYTGPIFEVHVRGEEDVGSVAGGGRYDTLIQLCGGKPTPATGISLGVERVVLVMERKGLFSDLGPGIDVYVAPVGAGVGKALEVSGILREAGFRVYVDVMGRRLSKQLEHASKLGVRVVVIVGPREAQRGVVALRDMGLEAQREVGLERLVEEVSSIVQPPRRRGLSS